MRVFLQFYNKKESRTDVFCIFIDTRGRTTYVENSFLFNGSLQCYQLCEETSCDADLFGEPPPPHRGFPSDWGRDGLRGNGSGAVRYKPVMGGGGGWRHHEGSQIHLHLKLSKERLGEDEERLMWRPKQQRGRGVCKLTSMWRLSQLKICILCYINVFIMW